MSLRSTSRRESVLAYVHGHPGESATEIAKAVNAKCATVSGILNRAWNAGLVSRIHGLGPRGGFTYYQVSPDFGPWQHVKPKKGLRVTWVVGVGKQHRKHIPIEVAVVAGHVERWVVFQTNPKKVSQMWSLHDRVTGGTHFLYANTWAHVRTLAADRIQSILFQAQGYVRGSGVTIVPEPWPCPDCRRMCKGGDKWCRRCSPEKFSARSRGPHGARR